MSHAERGKKQEKHLGKRKSQASDDSKVEQRSKKLRKDKTSEVTHSEDTPSTNASILQTEERAFPRGGANVLTPFERKQIQIQATQDVLFEETGQKPEHRYDDDVSDVDHSLELDTDKQNPSKRPKQLNPNKKSSKPSNTTKSADDQVKPTGLKLKRLVPGAMILGQVSRIKANHITLDLPNNLSGIVPITAVSQVLSNKLETLAASEDHEAAHELAPKDNDTEIDLSNLFHIGQYLRTYVVSTLDDSSGKSHWNIKLSLDPRLANQGVEKHDIGIGCVLQAAVASVEDHGLVMDLGIQSGNTKGFMSSKEIPPNLQYQNIQPGMVFLCLVTGLSSNGAVIKLSANIRKAQSAINSGSMPTPPTVKSLLPGMGAELLVSKVSKAGISGQIMGTLNASADIIHSNLEHQTKNPESSYNQGDKVKTRILFTIPGTTRDKIGVSTREHILSLSPFRIKQNKLLIDPTEALPISSTVDKSKVLMIEPSIGLFLDVGVASTVAFVHISRISDRKAESISTVDGPFRDGSIHQSRIVGYNAVDGMFIASMQKTILEQEYLRQEDVPVGKIIEVTLVRLIVNAAGVAGLLVNLANGITGFIPEPHMSDIHLQHPERKFKEGMILKARVLSVDTETRQIRLTLKKTLLSTDTPIWTDYSQISPGDQSPGTIIKIGPDGAHLKFFGQLRAFLPVSEMSDTFVEDPSKHFRVGQAVHAHVLTVDPIAKRMIVSSQAQSDNDTAIAQAFAAIKPGQLVSGVVTEISKDDLSLELEESKCKASVRIGHLTDGSDKKNAHALSQIRVGLTMQDLVVLGKLDKTKSVVLSNKPSLVRDARQHKLLTDFKQVHPHAHVHGYVSNITEQGAFVAFAGQVTGLLHRTHIPDQSQDFGLRKDQSISAYILHVDYNQARFTLTLKEPTQQGGSTVTDGTTPHETAVNPVDGESHSLGDFQIGKIISARITSVKSSQLNIQLADNVYGRVDASEAFSSWEDIKDRQKPLKAFQSNQILRLRILGIHDARNHRFLPISHRSGKVPVFELSAKLEESTSLLSLDQLTVGSWHTAFVNNVTDACLWVNLSPNVRGRVERINISEDVSVVNDLEGNFPVGSAIRVWVKHIDQANGHLDLSARAGSVEVDLTLDSLSPGMIVTGRVTKITERSVLVQLGSNVVGAVGLTELADDFAVANPFNHNKNDIARVCVLEVDKPNKKVSLSTRPSKVLSSSLPVTDRHISSLDQLHVNDRLRGFIKNVADTGVFVSISHNITAFVRVSELSDSFLKDWKSHFEIDRLVTGRIISIDPTSNHVQLTLKDSVVSDNYVPRTSFNDMRVGQVFTGKIRKVEEFGAFIVVDNSHNVSGLCHRTEMANKPVQDARKVYEEGDKVKAIVLKIEPEKRRMSFGLKASYFENASDDENMSEDEEASGSDNESSEGSEKQAGVALPLQSKDRSGNDSDEDVSDAVSEALSAGGFDWTGGGQNNNMFTVESGPDDVQLKKPTVTNSNGLDLDAQSPRSASDFERLLLGQRDSSSLWVQYMAFHLQLGEVDEARKVAERALREINIREQEEKSNVWVAYLNLENAFGTEDSIEEVFNRACEFNDAREMHERLTSIYIESGKHSNAESLFQSMTKRKSFTPDPKLWLNYANFLFTTQSAPSQARGLLDRAMQSVPEHLHRDLVSKFAQLEFKCPNGDAERGRTMFEKLVDTYPKRWDIWDVWIEMEKGLQATEQNTENVRRLFERMTSLRMKTRRAKFAFRMWLEFEEGVGDQKTIDKVKARAREYVEGQRAGVE